MSQETHARCGVHSIDHFALEVPDLQVAQTFFDAFGLRVDRAAVGLDLHAAEGGHRWARLLQGGRKQLAYLAFNAYAQDIEPLRAQAVAAGAAIVGRHPAGGDEGFWFRDPDGNLLQVRAGPKTSPDARLSDGGLHAQAGGRGVNGRSSYGRVRPRRLSHVLMFTPDVPRIARFYEQTLGLRLSDWSEDAIAFLHARHGSDHHIVAFAHSDAKGLHHSSWDVPGLDHVGRGAAQMAAAGYARGWGTGRHVLGSNYFHYVQDPWGSFAEYSADIDFIPAGARWDGRGWPAEDSFYLWGPDVPDYFLVNSEAGR